jgi:hypothetical protein
MDEEKVTIAFPNRADEVSLFSLASWETNLPLTNIQNRVLAIKARSQDLNNIGFDGTFPQSRPVSAVALAAHNLSTDAQWRVRLYSDRTDVGTTDNLLYDSGFVAVWPAVYTQAELEWEDPNFWTGQPSDEERAQFTALATMFIDPYQVCEAFTIDIEDDNNEDGYVEIGRLFIGKAFQPAIGAAYGAETSFQVNTQIEEAQDGTDYFDEERPKRTAVFRLENMFVDEAYGPVNNMSRQLGISGELLFAYQLTQDPQFFARTFLGRLEQINPIVYPYYARFNTSIQIKEIL